MLFFGLRDSRTPRRSSSSDLVWGMICMSPYAPLRLTAAWLKLDSCFITARTRTQSTPYFSAYFLTIGVNRELRADNPNSTFGCDSVTAIPAISSSGVLSFERNSDVDGV